MGVVFDHILNNCKPTPRLRSSNMRCSRSLPNNPTTPLPMASRCHTDIRLPILHWYLHCLRSDPFCRNLWTCRRCRSQNFSEQWNGTARQMGQWSYLFQSLMRIFSRIQWEEKEVESNLCQRRHATIRQVTMVWQHVFQNEKARGVKQRLFKAPAGPFRQVTMVRTQ
jgi:hypothetical protein